VLAVTPVPTGAGDPGEVLDRVAAAAAGLLASHGPVAAAGAGVPGLFDEASGRTLLLPNLPAAWPSASPTWSPSCGPSGWWWAAGSRPPGERLFAPLRRAVAASAPLVDPAAYEIVPAALGPVVGAVGAALWARERAAAGAVTGGYGPRR
jgi:hypothetical protein